MGQHIEARNWVHATFVFHRISGEPLQMLTILYTNTLFFFIFLSLHVAKCNFSLWK